MVTVMNVRNYAFLIRNSEFAEAVCFFKLKPLGPSPSNCSRFVLAFLQEVWIAENITETMHWKAEHMTPNMSCTVVFRGELLLFYCISKIIYKFPSSFYLKKFHSDRTLA